MSSILSTSSCGEGTQTTSLPDWPTSGLNSASGACAKAQTAIAEKTSADNHRLVKHHTVMFFSRVGLPGLEADEMMAPPRPARQPLSRPGTELRFKFLSNSSSAPGVHAAVP